MAIVNIENDKNKQMKLAKMKCATETPQASHLFLFCLYVTCVKIIKIKTPIYDDRREMNEVNWRFRKWIEKWIITGQL